MIDRLQAEVFTILDAQLQPGPLLVGYSGGLDSRVLLELMARYVAVKPGFSLQAIHVHHGLNPKADEWLQHCQTVCAVLDVPLIARHAILEKKARESLEDVARQARYDLFREHLATGGFLLTAHHQDDQLETLLLALKRGSGPRGLSAMPRHIAFASGHLIRPLLSFDRRQLAEWAHNQHLSWIEDDSNQNEQFDRNFLRHSVIPLLRERWPEIAATTSRTASLCAEQESLLDEITALDLNTVKYRDGSLQIAHLAVLSPARRHQLLRYWLRELTGTVPTQSQLHKIWPEVALAREDAMPELIWQKGSVRRYQQRLYQLNRPVTSPFCRQAIPINQPLELSSGTLTLSSDMTTPAQLRMPLQNEPLSVTCNLAGSVKMHPLGRQHSRELKKLWQEYEVAPWLRGSIPIICYGNTVAAVAGLFICQGFGCPENESGLNIHWQPNV
jgi:tRNA(Ile)-lysidine synthetase, N-terminal domain/tRNA(Ile)-lysidine synthetase, C-terminal domain